ncbi:class F sortase [Streptomyces sp. NPDC051567]|uniref:class F sortase n=1 Tax=Streptomyces sp. NPDC051567 TaxID=3365660 RepID=UPI0037A0270B
MSRAKWVVGALTVALLFTGMGVLHHSEGARPSATTPDDALPSRALGLSGHRRLVRELEHSGEHAPVAGARPARGALAPLRAARPLRLRIPALGVDLPLTGDREGAVWDTGSPAPGAAGTAVVTTGSGPRLDGLRRGQSVEITRADGRTAVFSVLRVSSGEAGGRGSRAGRAQLRLVSGETTVLARLTGQRRTR